MSEKQNNNQDLIGALVQSLQTGHFEEDEEEIATEKESYGEEYITQLQAACKNFLKKETFQVGQLVKWKEYLKNRKIPYKNQPAVVVEILEEPILSDDDESGSPYFRENLDIILGILVDDNVFLTFYYDSRRFESY
ncbi:hypothetical protein [Sphaerospermopsis sp. LEGE 08334]|jgi:hypothetical protein|uniref:hypothetical protein n=1 Tax=Sphaerospermopsis sp. LEGE 08334 TaxID=1828651 RepID=UPI001881E905|nr:hypothetical protein [Sphaerospermopsis sp. LEGE 08334]MBE9058333.1 hypothetical protein [Sphaerospermopsis sp. LEGE 08334]